MCIIVTSQECIVARTQRGREGGTDSEKMLKEKLWMDQLANLPPASHA